MLRILRLKKTSLYEEQFFIRYVLRPNPLILFFSWLFPWQFILAHTYISPPSPTTPLLSELFRFID